MNPVHIASYTVESEYMLPEGDANTSETREKFAIVDIVNNFFILLQWMQKICLLSSTLINHGFIAVNVFFKFHTELSCKL